jgi:Fructose-bisphosphate aldolase class-I
VLKIGAGEPSELAIHENAYGLARYASICQVRGAASPRALENPSCVPASQIDRIKGP